MIHSKVLHNGVIRPSSEFGLNVGQVGLLNGWGVFSTLKVVDGVLFAYARHWARMRRDAELMRVPFPWSPQELEDLLLQVVAANQSFNSTLRVIVVRNHGTMWQGDAVKAECDLIAFTADRSRWGSSCKLGIVPHARHAASRFAGTKITSWASNLIWYEEAHLRGQDEVVLLNERSEVSECTSANLFAVFGNEVFTPPLESSGCLPGITRQLLLEEIRVEGITVQEKVLDLPALEKADGIFITSSTRDLIAVNAIEGLSIREEDRVRPALHTALQAYEAKYVETATRRAVPSAAPAR